MALHVADSGGRVRPAAPTGHSALTAAQQRALAGQKYDEAWIADEDEGRVAPMDGVGAEYHFGAPLPFYFSLLQAEGLAKTLS